MELSTGVLLNILLLCASQVVPSSATLGVSTTEMQRAVDTLASRFTSIRNQGLGINALETALRAAPYITSTLSNNVIEDLLSNNTFQILVDDVVSLFNSVNSSLSGGGPSLNPMNCCDQAAGSPPVCTYISGNPAIAGTLNTFTSLEQGEAIMFGAVDGSIIRVSLPSPPYATSPCTNPDSRLLPWFVSGVRRNSRPLEVVILLDILETIDMDARKRIREAAILVINSLTTSDKVGVVVLDFSPRLPSVQGNSMQVVPICDYTSFEMESFITSITPFATGLSQTKFPESINQSLELFTNDSYTEKHLLFFTLSQEISILTYVPTLENLISVFTTSITVSVFQAVEPFINPNPLENVPTDKVNGFVYLNPASNLPTLMGGYYSIPNSTSTALLVDRTNTKDGSSLTFSQPVFNGTTLLGVLHGILPFTKLISSLLTILDQRPLSYAFVLGPGRVPLYHPLLPGDTKAIVSIASLEPEEELEPLLDSNTVRNAAVVKEHLTSTGSSGSESYVRRMVQYTYHCITTSTTAGNFTLCLVLADEEVSLRSLDISYINIQDLYGSRLTPIYHNLGISVQESQLCNYFCKQSINSRISFQLTSPSDPTTSGFSEQELLDKLSAYISDGSTRPSFVRAGVAEEAAVVLAVADEWLDTNSLPSNYITRRHMATPNGLYLTYPPTHITSEFQPSLTEWYLSPIAHPSLLTVTPPHIDTLREGSKLTVSVGYALRAPSSQSDEDLGDEGPPLVVVAGEITLKSLRAFMDEAMPTCSSQSVFDCVIVDDRGNFVYEMELDNFNGESKFLGRRDDILRVLLFNITSPLISKRQCLDLFSVQLGSRTFQNLNVSLDDVVQSPAAHCTEFMIQRIPGTNIFLVVFKKNEECQSNLCLCTEKCVNCEVFSEKLCECPCHCTGSCATPEIGIPMCPRINPQTANFVSVATNELGWDDTELSCFNQECRCRTNFSSCFGVRECHWCERENKCVQNTECCDQGNGRNCCGDSTQEDRFEVFGDTCIAIATMCFKNPGGSLSSSCDIPTSYFTTSVLSPKRRNNANTAIISGVIGTLLGALLIAVIIILLIYYQFFRKVDPQEEGSRESAFDFSNKTALGAKSADKNDKGKKSSKTEELSEKEKEVEEEKIVSPVDQKDETKL